MKYIILILLSLFPVLSRGQVVKDVKQLNDRVNVTFQEGTLCILPLNDNAVRIKFFKETESNLPELIFISNSIVPEFLVSDLPSELQIKLKNITASLDKHTGSLYYKDNTGKVFLSEKEGSRKLVPGSIMGETCFLTEQSFQSPNDEHIFGLGQFQDGHYNLRNITRRLIQVNSQIAIPFIYSNKGYGLLWHQYGLTDFNPTDNIIKLEKQTNQDTSKQLAEVTTTSGTQRVSQNQSLYKGKFITPEDGVYSVFLNLGNMDNRHYLVIDGKVHIDQSNFWLPPSVSTLVELKAGEHNIELICKSDNTPVVSWKSVDNSTTFRSPNAKQLDYVVFYGPSADSVISSYRNLSGNVPMLPLWAYGFWQCRERYTSGSHLVETAKEFRRRNLPVDVIVQDWQYWGNNGRGVPMFDEINYPNPAGFIKELHDLNTHFNISIWSNPDKNSAIGKDYVSKNLFIPGTKWLDYFNPVTRKAYWNTLKNNLFTYGVDSWWMDATEPENDALKGERTFIGLGDFYRLTYPLYVCQSVYEGQRELTSDKRVCIMTRSAFPGQQRYGTINWSGDINGTWDGFRRQITAGLNYNITGFPYWTTDIGGFFRPGQSQYTDKYYHELLIRWFQWGVFNPIFRVHGYQSETEPWKYGDIVENDILKMLKLRYRLIPYIYSEAWQVTKNGSTIMRPLVMDFNNDTTALNQPFQYMFGKNFLAAPVVEPGVKEWHVYLPKSADWFDFWTGEKISGGQTVNKTISLDIIPLYVKAGSILPIGPEVQYANEKKWDSLEIRIYPGADGEFTLYEDEGDNYNYEKGNYSTITFRWDDIKKSLTVDDRNGEFAGSLSEQVYNIVLVRTNNGIGFENTPNVKTTLHYSGKKIVIKLTD